MGQLSEIIPQGPNIHCGLLASHSRHPNSGTPSWCDGIPPLEPFIELVVRVQLKDHLNPGGLTHSQLLKDIQEEGLQTYVWDEIDTSGTVAALRVRWGGNDRVYPVVNGEVVTDEPPH